MQLELETRVEEVLLTMHKLYAVYGDATLVTLNKDLKLATRELLLAADTHP